MPISTILTIFFTALSSAFGVGFAVAVSGLKRARKTAEESESRARAALADSYAAVSARDALSGELSALKNELSSLKVEREKLLSEKLTAERNLAAFGEKLAALSERAKNRESDEIALREKLAADFKILSNRIFEESRQKLSSENAERIGLLLAPLKSNLKEFGERVEKLGESGVKSSASMSAQLDGLMKLNTRLGDEARNLADALRSNNKVAGNWGESVLERIFESCGFVEGIHFRSQKNYADTGGSQVRLMPDFVVYLPENRSIVVDSKLSLVDFTDYVAASDAASKRVAITKFKKSVREHLKEFQNKYNDLPDVTCSFKMMFMPVEPAYRLIADEDPQLVADAYSSNVLIVGPSNVMAVLKFAEIAYRNDAFAKNIKDIIDIGRKLYQRVELFAKKFDGVGNKILQLQKEYDETRTTLSGGGRSLLDTAKRFVEKSRSANIDIEDTDNDGQHQ